MTVGNNDNNTPFHKDTHSLLDSRGDGSGDYNTTVSIYTVWPWEEGYCSRHLDVSEVLEHESTAALEMYSEQRVGYKALML